MSERCYLTIYEPEKDPRVVELQIDPSNSEENDVSVYNEDGTTLQDYQLYLETRDDQLIKVPCPNDKSRGKWNTLKFWKNLVSPAKTIVGDFPITEKARDFLKTCMVNSTKKEKKIARVKGLRSMVADKKLKNKLKKQRKKEVRKFFSDYFSPQPISVPSKRNIIVDSPSNDNSSVNGTSSKRAFVRNDSVQKKLSRKQLSKRNALNVEQSVESNVQNTSSSKKRKRPSKKARMQKKLDLQNLNGANESKGTSESNHTFTSEPSTSLDENTANSVTSSRIVEPNSSVVRWNASEPALDFIPVARCDQNEDAADFLSLDTSKNKYPNSYSRFLSNVNPRSRKNEYVGLSQKAFFLQC